MVQSAPVCRYNSFAQPDRVARPLAKISAGLLVAGARRRYSPAPFVKCTKEVVGDRAKSLVSTSLVEPASLSMRMGTRRFTRLTNSFSKKLENHMHAVSSYFMVYNL